MKKIIKILLFLGFFAEGFCDDIYESNNLKENAKVIDNGFYNLTAQDIDWFKLNLNIGELNLEMTPSTLVDLNMTLYNSNNQIVAANWSNNIEKISYAVVVEGNYYLKIEPTSSSGTNYTLLVDNKSLTVWQKEFNYGPIRDNSISLFDIDLDGKDEIFIGTSKTLDSQLNEIKPAGLLCLEDDGTLKWAISFPAMSTPDPQTGKTYNTTSVSTTASFSDIDNDNQIDILIGVGADTYSEAGSTVVGQPGDKGGVYAIDKNGNIKWFHESLDIIGGTQNSGDGRPDGVYGVPVIVDLDKDGKKDIVYNSWDQSTWVLDAKTGNTKFHVHLADTIWSTPKIADINSDGNLDILVSADITQNSNAQTSTGGIFHILNSAGEQNINGFNTPIGNPNYATLRGKYEEQALWSSPITFDIDNDGFLEIIYGTGNFFHDERGTYLRVWNHDGTEKFKLHTIGRTFSTPIVVDLDNDGDYEIVATTLEGYVFAWDHNGNQLFATQTLSYLATQGNPIFSSPLAVDINNDGFLEIIYPQGAQIVIVNYYGLQISNRTKKEMIFEEYKGTPAIKDIDKDNIIDIISGGTNTVKDRAIVYRWKFQYEPNIVDNYLTGKYQYFQSNNNIEDFVKRFYLTVLNREAETAGLIYWVDELSTMIGSGSDVARGFIFSQEFINRNVGNQEYLNILYQAFFNREADSQGFEDWLNQLNNGVTREKVLNGFLYSLEFNNLCKKYNILPIK